MNSLVKKIIPVILLCSAAAVVSKAQTPAPYAPTININYVREWSPTAPISDPNIVPTRVVEEVKTTTAYVDGLGRPLQSVSKQASPSKKDLVNATVYDAYGRETYKYLPFTSTTTAGGTEITDNGSFKLDPFQQQATFMNAQYGSQGEIYFYGQTDYEASPLNRPIKSFAPGNSWAGSRGTTSEKSVQQQYLLNTTADALILWTIGSAQGSLPTTTGNYAAGLLYKNISIDERGKQMVEFKDKEGKVLLKKVQAAGTVTDGHSGWLCTYYVYDDLNQLRFVIPPRATEAYLLGNAISSFADELCFRYEYDYRHRMIIKKIPGAAEVDMVYDARGRTVMTQDGNLRTLGKWMVTVYDALNRIVQTGLLTDGSTSFAIHLSNADASSNYPSTTANFELLSENYYDDYSWVAGSGTILSSTIDATNLTNSSYFLTTYNAAPYFALPLTTNYVIKGMLTGSKIKVLETANQFLYVVTFYDEKGRLIQTQSINASGGKDITTTQYDFSGKPLRSLLQHNKAGANAQTHTVLTKLEYDHLGRVLYARKQITSVVGGQTIASTEKTILQNSYDELGQLKTKKIGNKPNNITELETLRYDYNIRGWLLGVNRGYISGATSPTPGAGPYFGFELAYDKITASATGTAYTVAQYNGNIAGTQWKSKGDQVARQYDYAYDNVNRLLRADFKQNNPDGSGWNKNIVDYTTVMGNGSDYTTAYDANGNIKQMQQYGLKINASSQIDNLHFNYGFNGGIYTNKLLNVVDDYNDNTTTLGDFRASALYQQTVPTKNALTTADYSYDINGNLTNDLNKDIADATGAVNGLKYNFLNLPLVITVKSTQTANKGTVSYIYDSRGNKLQKITFEKNVVTLYNGTTTCDVTTTTDYINGFIYESKNYANATLNTALGYTNILQFITQEEGRMRPIYNGQLLTGFAFDYMIKDHLGNTRMVLTDEALQDHYPTATLEDNAVAQEQKYYDININYVVPKPANVPTYINDNGTNNPNTFGTPTANSQKMYQLNAANNRTGLNMVLKVMAGDQLDILAKSYYEYAAGTTVINTNFSVTDLLNAFLGTAAGNNPAVLHGGITSTLNNNVTGTVTPVNGFLNNPGNTNSNNNVKAGLCYILFDEQFNYVAGGFDPVNSAAIGGYKPHFLQGIPVTKNGYIYIYVSNESNINVFFDNLEVNHTRGQILEETHYYPFGLTMAGISSKAAGRLINKYRYNGKEQQSHEFSDGSGLELYDYGARMQDPQLGRWFVIDPLTEQSRRWSCYTYANDNPIKFIDMDGMSPSNPQDYKLTSVDLDRNGKVVKINDDGDPGVYLNTAQGKRVLVGYMDPKHKYILGDTYSLYCGQDYYIKHPMATWLGMKIPDPLNPDQKNDEAVKREALGDAVMIITFNELFELFGDVASTGNAVRKGVSVIGPRATYRQFAKLIGAKFLDVTDEAWTWAKNEKFLAEVVKRGDDVIFAGKFEAKLLDVTSVLAKEIKYLTDHGYQWASDFSKLIKQ